MQTDHPAQTPQIGAVHQNLRPKVQYEGVKLLLFINLKVQFGLRSVNVTV